MFGNYLIVALRNIARHKLHSFINIAGLAVGLACLIFVILFVRDETSYDRWLPGTQNLYRMELSILVPGRAPMAFAVIPYPMPQALQEAIPEITGVTGLQQESMTLTVGDRQFLEPVDVVDPGFFKIVKLSLVSGTPDTVFRQPESVVLSQSYARKYFGDADPIGKIITTGRGTCGDGDLACKSQLVNLKVTGIARDIPHNSQLSGDVFVPDTSAADRNSQDNKHSWLSNNGYGYVSLAPGTDPARVVAKAGLVFDTAITGELHQFGINRTGSQTYKLHLTPFTGVHLNSGQWSFNLTTPGSWTTVYGVAAIGLLILLVACFNFMNMATARAMMRAREIALRKTLGARRPQLVRQFLGEAVLIALLALMLALALVEVLLPAFGRFLQRPITFHYLADWPLLLLIVGAAIVAGLISGFYPALVLSRFRPAAVLRANSAGQAGSGRLRGILVVLQFSVSIGLGIAALVVFSQVSYARNIGLGFNRDSILILSGGGRVTADGHSSLVQTLRAYPGILAIGMANRMPFETGQSNVVVRIPGQPDNLLINEMQISPDFPDVIGMHLLAGRLFSDSRTEDKMDLISAWAGGHPNPMPQNEGHNIMVNAAAAARMGFSPQEAVGKTILMNQIHVHIVGVLADANFLGAREPIRPMIYEYDPRMPVTLALRLRPGTVPQTLAFIDKSWHAFSPITAIQRHFLDESFDKLYRADEKQGAMFGTFVAIAIAIACLGLFGLAAFTAGRRTREIGIRKVFGARTREIVLLLLWQFSIPIVLANLIAWPLAWYYLNHWLQGFAYRITLSPLYFVATGLAALLIAWATVLTHALRVARANPIHALRHE
jgi:putative ABC transport system permease protein